MVGETDYRTTVRRGRRIGGTTMVLHADRHAVRPAADTGPLVGFVVSKAVGNAVVRNRVKRRLRHLAATRLRDLPPGSRIVVRALPAAVAQPRRLGDDFDRAWNRALTWVNG